MAEFVLTLGILALFFIVPIKLTVNNIKSLFKNENEHTEYIHLIQKKRKKELLSDIITIVLGFIYSVLLIGVFFEIKDSDWYDPIYPKEFHRLLHSEYEITVIITIILAYIGLSVLCIFNPEKLPPLLSVFAISFTLIGLSVGAVIYIQLAYNFNFMHLFLYLYYANLILIAIRRIRFHISEHVRLVNERETVFRNKLAEKLYGMMRSISKMQLFCFIMILPVAAILEIIFILLGQGPDGFIKAFTETADWTFSLQTPPPPLEYEGHYLCTIAAGGHKKVVKPLRYGKRLGMKIVVNRQLLAANAFEDLIKEKLPRFHRFIRHIYDKYGYPISRHITTQLRADFIYILMKPLEFIFITVLYLFDNHPENRISVQYSDCKLYNK